MNGYLGTVTYLCEFECAEQKAFPIMRLAWFFTALCVWACVCVFVWAFDSLLFRWILEAVDRKRDPILNISLWINRAERNIIARLIRLAHIFSFLLLLLLCYVYESGHLHWLWLPFKMITWIEL